MVLPALVLCCLALFAQDVFGAGKTPAWSYGGDNGPSTWGSKFSACAGKRQSPINIETSKAVPEKIAPLTFLNYEKKVNGLRIWNNGSFIWAEMTKPFLTRLGGGGLKGDYAFSHFRFHWGDVHDFGAEHTINGSRSAMELQLVHYNTLYGFFDQAESKPDGLAILTVLFDTSTEDIPLYTPIVSNTRKFHTSGSSTEVNINFPLRDFLPSNVEKFYCYQGSLTSPPCYETVTWFIFPTPNCISMRQQVDLALIRNYKDDYMVNNYRPVQPLNGRRLVVRTPK